MRRGVSVCVCVCVWGSGGVTVELMAVELLETAVMGDGVTCCVH